MSSTQKSTQKMQDKKQEGSRKQDYVIVEKTKTLPMQFYRDVIEAENLFISKPSCESCENLLLLYKSAAEFYSKFDKENEHVFVSQIQKTLSTSTAMKLFAAKEQKLPQKKIKNRNFKLYIQKYNLNSIDYKMQAKAIIKYQMEVMKKTNNLIKASENQQKYKFSQSSKIKTIKKLLAHEEDSDDEPMFRNRNSTQYNLTSSVLIEGPKVKKPNLRHLRAHLSSDFDIENIICSQKDNKPKNSIKPKEFHAKPETSDEIIDFLKDYNKRLYYLFQTNISNSLDKLNNHLDKIYRKKINRHFEYMDNLGEFELMLAGDENMKSEIGGLINTLKKDYYGDMEKLENEENKKMSKICNHYGKKHLNDNVVIGNLNVETLGQVIRIFKE